jgi:hypothetical protein
MRFFADESLKSVLKMPRFGIRSNNGDLAA